jgi:hypothetical protein
VPKKLLGIAAILLAVWFLVTRPEDAADLVRSAGDLVIDAFEAIVTFITNVFA